jgi:hypothetical protein
MAHLVVRISGQAGGCPVGGAEVEGAVEYVAEEEAGEVARAGGNLRAVSAGQSDVSGVGAAWVAGASLDVPRGEA